MVELDLYIPFNSINRDRAHKAEGLAEMISSVLTDGIMPQPGDTFVVTAAGGWDIDVAPGRCNIRGRLGVSYEPKRLTLGLPSAPLNRIDSVVLGMEPNTLRMIYLRIKQGVATQNPTHPELQRDENVWEMGLCDIAVSANAVNITSGAIHDTRHLAERCGIVNSLIKVEPDALFAQYEAIWAEWISQYKQDVSNQYGGFVADVQSLTDGAQNQYGAYTETIDGLSVAANDDFVEYSEELSDFKANAFDAYGQWYNAFIASAQAQFESWYADYLSSLGPEEAITLLNRIYTHEQATVASSANGVHGIRYYDGALQIYTGAGWITMANAVVGLPWSYIDSLNRIWQEWDALNYTWAEFENLIESEVA